MVRRDDARAEQWPSDAGTASPAATTHMPCGLRNEPEEPAIEASAPRVLIVGPMPEPPLLGGIETGIALLFRTRLARAASMTLFNTWRTPDATRPSLQKLGYQIGMSWKFLMTVVRTR